MARPRVATLLSYAFADGVPKRALDSEVSAQKCGREFGDQLLGRIGLGAEAVLEIAVEALFSACPVTELVDLGRVKVLHRAERISRRHDDVVERWDVHRLIAAVLISAPVAFTKASTPSSRSTSVRITGCVSGRPSICATLKTV